MTVSETNRNLLLGHNFVVLCLHVIGYVSKRSAENFGYLTHKGNNQDNSGRAIRRTTHLPDYKVNDLAFADDIVLLENDSTQAQRQLDKLEHEAKKLVLRLTFKRQSKCV